MDGVSDPRPKKEGAAPEPFRSPPKPADVVQRLRASRERDWKAFQAKTAAAPTRGVSWVQVLTGLVTLILLLLVAWRHFEGQLIGVTLLLCAAGGAGVVWLLFKDAEKFTFARILGVNLAWMVGICLISGLFILLGGLDVWPALRKLLLFY